MAKKLKKRDDITIDGSIATYTFSHQSLNRGTLIGTFKFKCFLLPTEQLAIGRDKRNLLGEFELLASPEDKYLAFALSELKQRIIQAPLFWSTDIFPGNIEDLEFIDKVLDAAVYSQGYYGQLKQDERKKLLDKALKDAQALVDKQQEEKEANSDKNSEEEESENED